MVAAAITAARHQGSAPGVQECSRAYVAGGTDSSQPLLSELLRRVQKNETPGFPRFKGRNRFNSLVFTPTAFQVQGNHVAISKVGNIKIKMHRRLPEKHGTLFLKQICGSRYACFSCEVAPPVFPESTEEIGVDVGLDSFAVLSDGTPIKNPRWYRKAQAQLRKAQRRVARRKKGSQRRRQAVAVLQKIHEHVANQRKDFQHQEASKLVQRHGVIAVEDLTVKGLAGGRLAKSVQDAGWGGFLQMLAYKAESAGRQLFAVDPRGTTQTCVCGAKVPKRLSDREHVCTACGLMASRVSAQVILQRARKVPSSANVGEVMPCLA